MKNYKTDMKKDLAKNADLYKMNEISKKLNLTARTIRYYESEGLLGNVKRSIGYTRYFTNHDIKRLREIIALKKKGYKIAHIKDLFLKKYSTNDQEGVRYECSIDATLIEENDIAKCLTMGITVNDIELIINNVQLNYMQWRSISNAEFLKAFDIKFNTTSSLPRISVLQQNQWLGNGQRSIIIDALNRQPEITLNQDYIKHQLSNVTEWIFFPITINSPVQFNHSLTGFYYLEKRNQGKSETYIMSLNELFLLLDKQIKSVSSSVNGLLKQVTFHRSENMDDHLKITQFIESLVLNKDYLAVEDLSPIYIQSVGTNNVYLLSTLI